MRAVIHMRKLSLAITLAVAVACDGSTEPAPGFWTASDTIILVGQTMDARGIVKTLSGSPPGAGAEVVIAVGDASAFAISGLSITALAPAAARANIYESRTQSNAAFRLGALADLRTRWRFDSRCQGIGGAKDSVFTHFATNSVASFSGPAFFSNNVAFDGRPSWANGVPIQSVLANGTKLDSVIRWTVHPNETAPRPDTSVATSTVYNLISTDTASRILFVEGFDQNQSHRQASIPLVATTPLAAAGDALLFCGFSSYNAPSDPKMTMELRAIP